MLEHQMYPWTLGDATMFVRKLYEVVAPAGFEVAITGDVLMKGRSLRDLDVILSPICVGKENYKRVLQALQEFGMLQKHGVAAVHQNWRNTGSQDTKHMEIWDYNGKRVNLFFLK
jgi:hypothetical protein